MGYTFVPSPMRSEKPLLKIKISGPAIKPGRIPIPLLVDICNETQKAVNREVQALEGKTSLRPGPPTKNVTRECTLELIGVERGSTILNFVPQSDQGVLPELAIRTAAIDGVAKALKSLGKRRGKPEPIDFGLLDALDHLGGVLEKGVSRLQLIVPPHNGQKKNFIADLTPAIRPKIKARLQPSLLVIGSPKPAETSFLLEGTLELTEGKGRIVPAVGSPTLFSFGSDKATAVIEATKKPVRATVDPKTHKLENVEITAPPLLGGDRGFFVAKTIDQLIAEQGVHPIDDLKSLAGAIPDDDVDEFVADIYRDRQA